jgi:diphosphomevalonate decarboxylase
VTQNPVCITPNDLSYLAPDFNAECGRRKTILKRVTARAHANIALVKYWGKRDAALNLPAVGSISLTLDALHTTTTVEFSSQLKADELILNGQPATAARLQRVSVFLNRVRDLAGISQFARVESENNFPTGAGLASSASAFASLALAATRAAGLELSPARLSQLARLGSGSAARSIFGGLVEMNPGTRTDGSDAVAHPLLSPQEWDLRLLIAITSESEKEIGSTEGMEHTAQTSPFYGQWVATSRQDIEAMRQAIFARDFTRLGEIAEYSCLKMHAVALSARPGLLYWNDTTVRLMHAIRQMRREGLPVYFTIDAGPQVKAICQPDIQAAVAKRLSAIPGVLRIISAGPGPGAHVLQEEQV